MEKCWANLLQDCEGVISREHTISKTILRSFDGTKINVIGLPWCEDKAKQVGIEALTTKCLCKEHNSKLSGIDAAAGHAFNTLKKLGIERNNTPNNKFKKVTFSINATALERWLLKTLINILYDDEYYIGHGSNQLGRPSEHLVKVAFGLEPFRKNNGMYVAAKLNGTLKCEDIVQFSPIIKDEFIYAGMFSFRGILLFLDISPDGIKKIPFDLISPTQIDWHNVSLSKRLKQIKSTQGGKLSHVINFNRFK